ncbi:MAG: hypothetical protein V4689_18610 [Verrucomicrobiota bacterium]
MNPRSAATCSGDFPPISMRRATTIRSRRIHSFGGRPTSRVKTS